MGNKEKNFVLRIKNNITLEMLENEKCKVGTGKDAIEVRVVMFCDLKKRTEFRLATDLPSEGDSAVSNEENSKNICTKMANRTAVEIFKNAPKTR